MLKSVSWSSFSNYDGITDVTLTLPPKIPIKAEYKKGSLKVLEKNPRQLCVFFPQGIFQLLNMHALSKAQRNQAESNSQ